jgi:uncharacterized SAM-binding protein YcdF (DUF218 family)
VTPTRGPVLAGLAAVAALFGWTGAALLVSLGQPLPRVPLSAPLVLLLLAAILLATALSTRARLAAMRERRPDARPVNPLVTARAAVLAKASSPVGALVVGLYAGYGGYLVQEIAIGARRQLALLCGFAVLSGVAVVAAALFLESVCRLPPPDEEPGRPLGGAEQSS